MDPKAAKEHLRSAIKERLARVSDKERINEGRSVSRRIIQLLPPEPVAIAAYIPMKSEVDITLLLEYLLEKGYPLYLPRGEGRAFAFRKIESLPSLVVGPFGVGEPPAKSPLLQPKDLAIAIVPARAYTKTGQRLGRGNGGYDIWIRAQRLANPNTKFWGVVLEQQVMPEVPMEAHDETVDAVITARGMVE